MDNYICITLVTTLQGQKDLLIGMLSQIGYDGFEEEQMVLKAFIAEQLFDEAALRVILEPLSLKHESNLIPATNWNAEWEQNFKPVLVDSFCCIRASFHEAVEGVQYDIIITPRMSFGTGHHATTYLMIKQMKNIRLAGLSVLDFGTGTGVLAILAEKMGADFVTAFDNDEWSIRNAGENIVENNCGVIQISRADSIEGDTRFDVILANINRHVLLDNMDKMAQHLKPGGVLLMSGLLSGDRDMIESRADLYKLVIKHESEREGWIVLELIHK